MRHLLVALMGLLLLSVDVSAQELPLPNQVETVLRRRHNGHRCHRRHHSYSSTNVIVGPTGPMGLPGIPGATGPTGATGSLASSYASVYNNSNEGQQAITSGFTPIEFNRHESDVPPVNISTSSSTGDPGTFDTLQVQTSGFYLIGWKLSISTSLPFTPPIAQGSIFLRINNQIIASTTETQNLILGSFTLFAGQTIVHLNAGDTIQLIATRLDVFVEVTTTAYIPSLIVTKIAE